MNRLKIFQFRKGFSAYPLRFLGVSIAALAIWSCSQQDLGVNSPSNSGSIEKLSIDVAQTSGQLASGTDFYVSGSSSCDSTSKDHPGFGRGPGDHHGPGGGRNAGILDGLNLIAPTDELLAIVDAESASDIRGLRVSENGGASITNYNADGNEVTLALPGKNGPQGCSFSGQQFPGYDSLLSEIAKTEIDFGSGVTYKRDTIQITRSGKIIIERSTSGSTVTETTTFDNYKVNGILIEGTKTRTSTFDEETGSGSSATSVTDGRITFTDGTVAAWTSERSRVTDIDAGTVTTTVTTSVAAGSTVIYSHNTTTPLVENIKCHKPGPVSGVVATVYRANNITIDFGNGSCSSRTITITVNGTTTTRTIGE